MSTIRLLPEALRNQIAAGEVVERPASVVKELIENALDAGAQTVDIDVKSGGVESIVVRDDGTGMDQDDAKMALERHATSKIFEADDLFALSSFGFRGEALASIASIAEVLLTTKKPEALQALRIFGQSGEIQEVAAPNGTEVSVQNLFFNVPARRKFVKSAATENAHIAQTVEDIALANPEQSFRLKLDGKVGVDVTGANGETARKKRVLALFGEAFAAELLPIHYLGETLKISGFVSHPRVQRRNRKSQHFFVNKRPVNDRLMSAALSQAYESLVPKGFFPDAIVFIEIAPDLVDVNVHPRKSEVKFLHENEVFLAVRGAVQAALKPYREPIVRPEFGQEAWTLHAPKHSSQTSAAAAEKGFSFPKNHAQKSRDISQDADLFRAKITSEENAAPAEQTAHIFTQNKRIIGQIRHSFILIEQDDGLIIVDQHAAHERVRYERLLRAVKDKKSPQQKLLAPQVIMLSSAEILTLEAHQEALRNFGFEIQEFSSQEISLFAVPAGTEHIDFAENLKNLLHDLSGFAPDEAKAILAAEERIATFAACKGAIKFGTVLTMPEMEQLIHDLEKCETPHSCAHGRPVWTKIRYSQMENECGR